MLHARTTSEEARINASARRRPRKYKLGYVRGRLFRRLRRASEFIDKAFPTKGWEHESVDYEDGFHDGVSDELRAEAKRGMRK